MIRMPSTLTPRAGRWLASDPYAKYLNPPGGGAAAQADTPGYSEADYAKTPFSAIGRTFQNAATLGGGDLIAAHLQGTPLAQTKAHTAAAEASLPWYIRYPTEALGYSTLPLTLLNPFGDAAAAGTAAAVGGEGVLSALAGGATEGALAGGASSILGTDDPTVGGTLSGAAGGALLGGAAGAVRPLVNKGLTATMGKAASVDPVAEMNRTQTASDAAYTTMHQTPVNPADVSGPIKSAMPVPNSSEYTGMSDKLKGKIDEIQDALQNHQNAKTQPSLGDVNSWQRQVNEAATTSVDGKVAGKINAGLDGVMDATAPGLNDAAQTAAKQAAMAAKMQEWNQRIKTGGSIGDQPFTQAQNFYNPVNNPANQADYDTLTGLMNAGANTHGLSWMLPHILGTGLSFAGEHVAGIPGAIAGELGGYFAGKKLLKSYNKRSGMAGLQAAYPQMTGATPTGGQTGPQIPAQTGMMPVGGGTKVGLNTGDLIKSLMMGGIGGY